MASEKILRAPSSRAAAVASSTLREREREAAAAAAAAAAAKRVSTTSSPTTFLPRERACIRAIRYVSGRHQRLFGNCSVGQGEDSDIRRVRGVGTRIVEVMEFPKLVALVLVSLSSSSHSRHFCLFHALYSASCYVYKLFLTFRPASHLCMCSRAV
jgi:hypothetical protein